MRMFFLGLALVGCLGCGNPEAGQAVHGTVTVDGAPLEQGTILFTPLDAKGDAASGEIRDGKFSIAASAGPHSGTHQVEIHALRKSGRQVQKPFAPEGVTVESDEEAIADEFSTRSTLTQEIKAGGNDVTFAVKSRPKQ